MNGVHDMGGMQGMGPISYEQDEPVFHATWEGRVHALTQALRAFRKWNIDVDRHTLELLPPDDYLRMSYYERWLARLEQHVVRFGLVTADELASGRASADSASSKPALTLARSTKWVDRGIASSADPSIPATFAVGNPVRTRNLHPVGHTRLPFYARWKRGIVRRDHGVYIFPDTNAHFRGERRQHVYSVQFAARELWGDDASPRDSVFLDLWDDYLERA
jgi:nitrile hydratase subunit beta